MTKNIPKRHEIYQTAIKRPDGHIIYQHLPMKDPLNFTQIWILGMKIYHLATVLLTDTLPRINFQSSIFFCSDLNWNPRPGIGSSPIRHVQTRFNASARRKKMRQNFDGYVTGPPEAILHSLKWRTQNEKKWITNRPHSLSGIVHLHLHVRIIRSRSYSKSSDKV
jgi:hypothetical protein